MGERPITKHGRAITKLGSPQTKLGRAVTKLGRPITKLGRAITKLGRPKTKLGRAMTKLERPMTKLGRHQTKLGRPIFKLERTITKLGRPVMGVWALQSGSNGSLEYWEVARTPRRTGALRGNGGDPPVKRLVARRVRNLSRGAECCAGLQSIFTLRTMSPLARNWRSPTTPWSSNCWF
jgi:hypothetical protein